MPQLNKKGFLLLDSLITVFVTSLACITCYTLYQVIIKYKDSYIEYQIRSNDNLENIFNSIEECEICELNESD